MKKLISIGFMLIPVLCVAQIKLKADFVEKLDQAELTFYEPLENSFKRAANLNSGLLNSDFSIKARKNKLEIRYLILPDEETPLADITHIRSLSMASHLATNSQEARISVHQMDTVLQSELYYADWAAEYYFQPKPGLSSRKHCKMTAIYKAQKGLAFILYFFDEADEVLMNNQWTLRFDTEDKPVN